MTAPVESNRVAAPNLRPIHPRAGQTVTVLLRGHHPSLGDNAVVEFRVEDWWDRLTGGSWGQAQGNPAALLYAMRTGLAAERTPLDDDVVYGHVGVAGVMIHDCEIMPAVES